MGTDVSLLATALADVLGAHAHVLVPLRLEQHLLDAAAVHLLDVRAVGEHAAVVLELRGQLVAHPLELAERQEPRAAARADVPVEAGARIRRAEQCAELALESRNLLPELAPDGRLVDLRRSDGRYSVEHLLLEPLQDLC